MNSTKDKIVQNDVFQEKIGNWKSDGLKVVFTNGCFDILHLGHVEYLEKAKGFGDKLVVGLNSDESVRRIKGPGRPINGEVARAKILAALEAVDLITGFAEDTPYDLIRKTGPNILVKGDDYNEEDIVGADIVKEHGGEVKTVPLLSGFSTTDLIKKIANN